MTAPRNSLKIKSQKAPRLSSTIAAKKLTGKVKIVDQIHKIGTKKYDFTSEIAVS